MDHDPLCPVGVKPWENTYCCQRCNSGETPPWERACQCDLIAKVRSDERNRCIEIVSDTYTENWRDCGWNSAVAWTLTRLRGEA